MKINIQAVNFKMTEILENYVNSRVNKFTTFFDNIIDISVYLRVENTTKKENKIAEIKVHVPKEEFIAKKQCKSFEEAVDRSSDALERMLKKRKEKK